LCACSRSLRAGVAQLVEYKLPKLGVAGSNPVARSTESSVSGCCKVGEVPRSSLKQLR
jgi:hypothetical protein